MREQRLELDKLFDRRRRQPLGRDRRRWAQAPSRPLRRRGSQASSRPTPTSRSRTTPSARAAAVSSSSRAANCLRRSDVGARRRRARPARRQRCGGADSLVEVPVYVSPIAVIYNLRGRRRASSSTPDDAGEASSRRRSPTGTTRRSRRRTRTSTLPDQRHHPGQPLGRVGHDARTSPTTCLRPRPASGRTRSAGDWPVKGGEAAAGHLGCRRRGQERRGHDRLRRREPGRRPGQSPSQGRRPSSSARPPEAAAKILDESEPTRRPAARTSSPSSSNRTPDASDTYPIVLVSLPDRAARSTTTPTTAAIVEGLLQLHRSARTASRRRAAGGRVGAAQRCDAREDPTGRRRDRAAR